MSIMFVDGAESPFTNIMDMVLPYGCLVLRGCNRGETIPVRGVTIPPDCAPEAHFGADFYPLNLEHIAVACNSGFPLPDSSGLLAARSTHYGHVMAACSSTFIC